MINKKIEAYLDRIAREYYELYQLKLDHFKIRLLGSGIEYKGKSIHITTSGENEKINARRKIFIESFKNQENIVVNSYFLCLAKLFERSKRNKPISITILLKLIKGNMHSLNDKATISKIIEQVEKEIESNSDLIDLIIEHRNKCIAHNDPKFHNCDHLENLHSDQTDKLDEIVKSCINSLSEIFDTTKINDSVLDEMASTSFDANYNLIKKLEK